MGFGLIPKAHLAWNLIDLGLYSSAGSIISEMLNAGYYEMARFLHDELRSAKNKNLESLTTLEYI